MRTLLLFVLIPFLSFAQSEKEYKRISISVSSVSLGQAIDEIQRVSGFSFSYSDDLIPMENVVSLSVQEKDIREVLRLLFKDLPIDFKITSNRVILKKVPPPLFHTVRGIITDERGVPVPGATIVVENTSPLMGTTSEPDGKFRISTVPVGRVSIRVSSVGFHTLWFRDFLLGTGKELVLDVKLVETVTAMDEIVVKARKDTLKLWTGWEKQGLIFTTEQAKRYAGSFGDPARMASSYAGVTGTSDESNALIVRGNSPRGVLWRVNGIEVPNPNHFATEGSSNGVISVLSSNIVDKSTLLKGAFAAPYGNALSAVLDVHLRNGNTENREHSFQIGALGLEVSTEGPLSKQKNASYLFNYRYSTLNMLDRVGVSLNDIGKYSDYQDIAFNFRSSGKRAGNFSFFGIGGKSRSLKKVLNGRDIDFSDVGITGVRHEFVLSPRTSLVSMLSWSGTRISNDRQIRNSAEALISLEENYSKHFFRGGIQVSHKFSGKIQVESGITYSRLFYDFYLRNLDPDNSLYEEIFNFREKGNSDIQQSFVSVSQKVLPKVDAYYGLHYIRFGLSKDYSVEPRFRLEWKTSNSGLVSLQFGKHSRIENLQYYLARDHQAGGDEIQVNRNLGFTRANHFGIGWTGAKFGHTLSVESYYQRLYNAPAQLDPSALYASINEDSGFITDTLINTGYGKNYGMEFTIEKPLMNSLYYLVNLSVYQSRFGLTKEAGQNTSYNGNYILHALIGKETRVQRNSLVGINFKGTLSGGRRYTAIDLASSTEAGYQVLDWEHPFERKLPHYVRMDMQLSYKTNHRHFSTEWRFDLQNFTHHKNIAYYYFDAADMKVRPRLQVGILPVLSCRIEF
jgi:hypothetical protein